MPADTGSWRDGDLGDPFELQPLGYRLPQPHDRLTVAARCCLEALILDGHLDITSDEIDDALDCVWRLVRLEAQIEAHRWRMAQHPPIYANPEGTSNG